MNLTKYHPSIRRLQVDFSARLARKRMLGMRGERPKIRIADNSEPWLRNPDSVSDDWYIASKVNERVKTWKPQQTDSSGH